MSIEYVDAYDDYLNRNKQVFLIFIRICSKGYNSYVELL
jgi:hypothetical protein